MEGEKSGVDENGPKNGLREIEILLKFWGSKGDLGENHGSKESEHNDHETWKWFEKWISKSWQKDNEDIIKFPTKNGFRGVD
jgi:hypothetical protein